MAPVLHYILQDVSNRPDGIICPGHVAVITGSDYFNFIAHDYSIPHVITGFEAEDILMAIYHLLKQTSIEQPAMPENLYKQWVKERGNLSALQHIDRVFESEDALWRGMGEIKGSGYRLRSSYEHLDAKKVFGIKQSGSLTQDHVCICGDVLMGRKTPEECGLFKKNCTPDTPRGPCMVSVEGTCLAYYLYGS